MGVLPVINCLDLDCVVKALHKIERFLPPDGWIHLDVADGRFTFHKTWNDPETWPKLKCNHSLEVHLMVEEPEKIADDWLQAGAKRLILQQEAVFGPHALYRKVRPEAVMQRILSLAYGHGAEVMLSLSPETPAEAARVHFGRITQYQILAVHPGVAGQAFIPAVLPKIKFLRQELPDATIEVDGGINPETAARVKQAGADIVTSGKYVLESNEPARAYAELCGI